MNSFRDNPDHMYWIGLTLGFVAGVTGMVVFV